MNPTDLPHLKLNSAAPGQAFPQGRLKTPFSTRVVGLVVACAVNLLVVLALAGYDVEVLPRRPSAPVILVDLVMDPPPPSAQLPIEPAKPVIEARPAAPRPVVTVPKLTDRIEAKPETPAIPAVAAQLAPSASLGAPASGLPVGTARPAKVPPHPMLAARDWVRKPSTAQLDRYRQIGSPAGFGVVSCITAPGRRVTDCVEVESSPAGSRLATAVRRAAWQFRIMPPRRDGVELIGEQILIRVDYVSPKIASE